MPLESEETKALTPNHFLVLSLNGAKPQREGINETGRAQFSELARREIVGRSWEMIKRQLDPFWNSWLIEYLPVIRRQPKWFDEIRTLEAGDLVMVPEPKKR